MRKTVIGLFLLIVMFIHLLSTQVVFASEPTVMKVSEQKHLVFKGVKRYHSTIDVKNDVGQSYRQNVNLVVKSIDAELVEVVPWAMFTSTGVWTFGNVKQIAEDFERKKPGYRVIAGVNGDYFAYPPSRTINMMVTQGGDIINPVNHHKYFSVGFSSSGQQLLRMEEIKYNDYYLTVYDENGAILYGEWLVGINKSSLSDGQTAVYFDTDVNISGVTKYIVSRPERLTNLGGAFFGRGAINDITTDTIKVSNRSFGIATKDETLKTILNQKPIIRVQRYPRWDALTIDHVIGVDSQIVKEGIIPSFSEIGGQSVDNTKSRHPRTSFGITEEGDFIIATVDGRQGSGPAGVVSYGVDLRELGAIMKSYGAVQAFNIDGGGSTQMVVRTDDGLVFVNSPSEGPHLGGSRYRTVANALLFVVPDVHVETTFKNPTASSIDLNYSISSLEDVNVKSVYLLLNNRTISLDRLSGERTLEGLSNEILNPLNIEVEYEKDGITYRRVIKSKLIDLRFGAGQRDPLPPSDFKVTFDPLDSNRLKLIIQFTDQDRMLDRIVVSHQQDTKVYVAQSEAPGIHSVVIEEIKPNTEYDFTIGYFIKDSVLIHPIEGDFTYQYTIDEEPDVEDNNQQASSIHWPSVILLVILGSMILISLVVYIIKR